ncbi:MAG: hypothetical protein ACLP8X_30635 [Streptosporangiaceae bacterium]
MLVIVVGAGVVFPLWVAFSPTGRLSTAAFAAFGWSVLVIGGAVWETAHEPAIVVHAYSTTRADRAVA